MRKLQFWERCIESNQTESFSNLYNFLIENQFKLDQNTKTNLIVHLRGLSATFREYFPVLLDSNNWIRNPSDESTSSHCRDWLLKIQRNWLKSPVITFLNWDSKVCHWLTFGWAWEKTTLCWQERQLQRCYHFQLPIFAKKHFLPIQIWKPSTETDSMHNRMYDFIFLQWYRNTKHYADQNKRILRIETFVQGFYRLRQIS
jgi:hypothetical protein